MVKIVAINAIKEGRFTKGRFAYILNVVRGLHHGEAIATNRPRSNVFPFRYPTATKYIELYKCPRTKSLLQSSKG